MGKASKWFRSLFGFKKPDPTNQPTQTQTNTHISKEKKRWSFVKSYREKNNQSQTSTTNGAACYGYYSSEFEPQNFDNDPNKRAIAVAAATAAVAEAAVAAAKAAAEVVRLTSSERGRKDDEDDDQDSCRDAAVYGGLNSGGGGVWVEEFAAVKIQAAFRGLLARRALRALRALVKIQALVRGHIERKRTAVELKQMQAVVRAQAQARARRARLSCSLSMKPSHSHHHHQHYRIASKSNGKSTADEDKVYLSLSWSDRRTENQPWSRAGPLTRTRSIDDEKTSDKILEIDTGKHHSALKRRSLSHLSHHAFHGLQYSNSFTTSKDSTLHNIPSPSSGEVNSYGIFHSVEEEVFCTAENNSPQLYSTPSRGGNIKRTPFTPARSDCSQSSMSVYSDYPNYLSYTESSKAKMRSLSAPKQRPQNERSIFVKRFGEQRSSSTKRAASLHTNYPIKEYPGSGYLDRFGMPVGL